eukprot:m.124292 g.124292  ORF g.124292 m.124292 type:complete len:226 (+) comp52172_c0_seq4:784-1461(+)
MCGQRGSTALHDAAHFNQREILTWFLQQGADVNALDSAGFTPLMLTAYCGNTNIVRELLAYGADTTIEGPHGTALQQASISWEILNFEEINAVFAEHERYVAQIGSHTKPAQRESAAPIAETGETDQQGTGQPINLLLVDEQRQPGGEVIGDDIGSASAEEAKPGVQLATLETASTTPSAISIAPSSQQRQSAELPVIPIDLSDLEAELELQLSSSRSPDTGDAD